MMMMMTGPITIHCAAS